MYCTECRDQNISISQVSAASPNTVVAFYIQEVRQFYNTLLKIGLRFMFEEKRSEREATSCYTNVNIATACCDNRDGVQQQ